MPEIKLLDQSQPETAERLFALSQRAYRVEAELIGASDFPPLRRRGWEFQQSSNRFYGLVENAELLAAAELEVAQQQGREMVIIGSFVVLPERFRSGLGSQLLQVILARTDGIDLQVETARQNEPAIGLYRKFGFSESSRHKNRDGYEIVTLELIRATSS